MTVLEALAILEPVPDALRVKECDSDPTVFCIHADLFNDKAGAPVKDCLAWFNVLCLLNMGSSPGPPCPCLEQRLWRLGQIQRGFRLDLRWETGTCYKAHERCGYCHRWPLSRPAINGVASAGRAKLFFSTWFSLQTFFAILVTLSSLRRVPDSCQFPIGLRAPTRAGGLGGSCRMREEITAGVF